MTSGKLRTREEIEKIVNDLGYVLLDEYMNKIRKRMVIIQEGCGYKYNVGLASLIQGHIPYFVAKGNPNALENILLWLQREEKTFELCENNEYKGNSKKLWFHCLVPECHENFDMSWHTIYSGKQECPYCSGQRVSDRNRLSIVRPDISSEWDHNLNDGTPADFSYGCKKEKFWICPKGHESYPSTIGNRTNVGRGCPRCAGKIVSDDNRLSILFSDIADEWDHELNEDTPHDVSFGSDKSRFWICPKGHKSYPSTISNRTNRANGCPRCADEQKESKVATGLKQWCSGNFKNIYHPERRMFKNTETGLWLRCDIYIGEPKSINGIYIEVHGEQHFKLNGFHNLLAEKKGTTPEKEYENQKYRDKMKKKYAKKNGTYIEVDLRKIKTTEQAIEYIENIITKI